MSASTINKSEIDFKMLQLSKSPFVKVVIYTLIFSYFMNLPVMFYSIKGDNEFRIYDLVGPFLVYIFYQEKVFFRFIIRNHFIYRRLFNFIKWCTFSLSITLFFAAYFEKLVWFLQCVLYVYHFWIFYLSAVLLFVMSYNLTFLKKIIQFYLIVSSVLCFIVILQNIDLIPYLWSDVYKSAYEGFLSGTLGPNKIVLGMVTLMSSVLCIGLVLENRITVNRSLIYIALALNLVTLMLSGSRTTYVGLIVFLAYFLYKDFKKFVLFGAFIVLVSGVLIYTDNPVKDRVDETINGRVFNKIENPDDLQDANVGKLYEDLGSGRDRLAINYIQYLIDNPYVIPFGIGMNNRLVMFSSAHNIYLSLIGEVGVFGFILYFFWLTSYFFIKIVDFPYLEMALKGLVFSMMVTLFFGEHLYIYRPVFAILGIFLIVTTLLSTPLLHQRLESDE